MHDTPSKTDLQEQPSLQDKLFQLDSYMRQVKGASLLRKAQIAEQAATLSASILAGLAIEQAKQAAQIDRLVFDFDGLA